ncbi:MAG: flagellar basal-body rod protein FlgF [Kiloniellales bacterium]
MENAGYIALSRQMVLRQQMDVIANNLANMNTSAFKGESMLFVEHLTKADDGKLLSFVQDLALVRNLEQGPITQSGNPLDLAIRGDGYFTVETPGGERYTRRGTFMLDQDGQIVTPEGYPLLAAGGTPIVIAPDSGPITIASDGTVSTDSDQLARIELVAFEDEQYLTRTEGGLYEAGDLNPEVVAEPNIQQGMIEGSNVKGIVEVTKLMETVRNYQSAAKLAEGEHERQRRAIENLVSV